MCIYVEEVTELYNACIDIKLDDNCCRSIESRAHGVVLALRSVYGQEAEKQRAEARAALRWASEGAGETPCDCRICSKR